MRRAELLEWLQQGDEIEESAIGALTEILAFDLGHVFALRDNELAEATSILRQLHDDSQKHQRMLKEVRRRVQEGTADDF